MKHGAGTTRAAGVWWPAMTDAPEIPPDDPHAEAVTIPAPRPEERTSERISRLARIPAGETVAVGFVLAQMRRRSFGGLFIALAGLGLVPGISLFAGLAMTIPALQMACGLHAPAFPRFVRRRPLSVARLRMLVRRTTPWLERLERHVRPRWPVMTQPPVANLAGLMIVGLAFALVLPLPFSNFLPAVAIVFLALGLLERDGVVMAIGMALGVVALVVGWFIAQIAFDMMLDFAVGYIE